MAVYTQVSLDMLEAFLAGFDIGHARSFKGIAEGVENSNYLLETDRGRFILTLYEKRVNAGDLPYFLGLMGHFARAGLRVPAPVADRTGEVIHQLAGRPACVIEFLSGVSVSEPDPVHCAALGTTLAHMHKAGVDFPGHRVNSMGPQALAALAGQCLDRADSIAPEFAAKLGSLMRRFAAQWPGGLPSGAVHADLFPDNVLFLDHEISGLIDFYFAATDAFAYDLAICLNAWCFSQDGQAFHEARARAMLQSYCKERDLNADERAALNLLCQAAAWRFLVTRAYDWLNTPTDAVVNRKDPLAYLRRLDFFAGNTALPLGLLEQR